MLSTRGRLLILTYHRVCPEPDALVTGNAHAAGFARQMQVLARAFRVLPLTEAAARLGAGTLPSRAVCISFDDGYADNAEVAAPILERFGLPATFFIATGFLDGGRMWTDTIIETVRAARGAVMDLEDLGLGRIALDDAAARAGAVERLIGACKYLAPGERAARVDAIAAAAGVDPPRDLMMRGEQVRALHAAGMEIGAHTVRHPILSAVSAAEAEAEIVASRDRLAELTGAPVRSFAYPNGKPGVDYSHVHVDAVHRAGFSVAVSTAWGAACPDDDPLQLPRVGFSDTARWRFPLRLLRAYGDAPPPAGEPAGYATH
jgi:peptidoglycan/xylan/chitin deacetylase (PgdA/CDA1 family)